MMSSGVFIKLSNCLTKTVPVTVIKALKHRVSNNPFMYTFFSSSYFPAPYYIPATMEIPDINPAINITKKPNIVPVAPTAAKALTPMALPTMTVSAMLYAFCKRLPSITGMEKLSISLIGFPVII